MHVKLDQIQTNCANLQTLEPSRGYGRLEASCLLKMRDLDRTWDSTNGVQLQTNYLVF